MGQFSRDEIVEAALALLDESGPGGLTMRALASRLQTYPTTVYWHLGDRDQVLAAVVERVFSEIEVPPGHDWRTFLADVGREYRRVMHRHPHVASLAASQHLVSPPSLGLVEQVLAALASAGLTGPTLVGAYNAFVGSVVGWVGVELIDAEPGAWQERFEDELRRLDPTTHPTITREYSALADAAIALRWTGGREHPLDDSFEIALTVWLDGLEATAAAAARGPASRTTGRDRRHLL